MKEIISLDQLDLENSQYSYADYLTWKFEQTVELIKGKISAMSAPTRYHQAISWELTLQLGIQLKNKPCQSFAAPFDVRFLDKNKSVRANKDIFTVVQPDLCVVCDKNKLDDKGCVGAPDLVVEILSRGNSSKEMTIKKQLYEEQGVREYWIFASEHGHVMRYHLTEDGVFSAPTIFVKEDILPSVIFPDLSINLNDVFHYE